jgi:fumarylacetoacetate (FAA) hydrolase family protein
MEDNIIGKKIIDIRPMTKAEIEEQYWQDDHEIGFALVLEGGTVLFPSRDYEGNGPGVLFGYNAMNHFAIG